MGLLRKKITTRDEGFIQSIEDFISQRTGQHLGLGRLSPEELHSLFYELFDCKTVISKRAKFVRISLQDLYETFTRKNNTPNILMMHETHGLLHPMDGVANGYHKVNSGIFDVSDLISTLNKRVTFFVGEMKKNSDVESSEDIFEVHEIQMYIPYEMDTVLHVKNSTFNRFTLEACSRKSTPFAIHHIYQEGTVLSEEQKLPSFSEEFFVFTTLKIHGATVVINFNP